MEVEETCPAEMLLHESKPTQSQVIRVENRVALPKQSIENTGDIDFEINSGANELIDPNSIRLYLEVQVMVGAGRRNVSTNNRGGGVRVPVPGSHVIPVNQLGTALFKNVEVKWNNELVYTAYNNYAHRCDLEARLCTSQQDKRHILPLAGFYEETNAFEDYTDAELPNGIAFNVVDEDEIPAHQGDVNFNERWFRTKDSKTWDLITPIYADIFMQDKYLTPNSTLNITLQRNDPKFCLLSRVADANFMVKIVKSELHYDIVVAEDSYIKEESFKTFNKDQPRLYPIKRTVVHKYGKGAHTRDLSEPSALMEKIVPRRIFLALTHEDAYKGSYTHDPFNYRDFNAQHVGITINGSGAKLKSYKMNYPANLFVDPVNGLLKHTSTYDDAVGINRGNFMDRNVIYSFDPNGLGSTAMTHAFIKEEIGTIGTDITLREDLPHNVSVIIFAEYDAEIQVGQDNIPKMKQYA